MSQGYTMINLKRNEVFQHDGSQHKEVANVEGDWLACFTF